MELIPPNSKKINIAAVFPIYIESGSITAAMH